MKKFLSILLAAVLVLSLGATAFAATQTETINTGAGSITVENAQKDETYKLYHLFDATYSEDATTGKQNVIYKIRNFDNMTAEQKAEAIAVFADATTVPGKWFECSANGEISARSDFDGIKLRAAGTTTDSVAGEFRAWAESYGALLKTVKATETTLKFDKLAYGYYMITSTLENSNITPPTNYITVNSNLPDVKVIDKNQGPNWDNGDDRPGKVIIDDQLHCGKDEHTHDETCGPEDARTCGKDEHTHTAAGGKCYQTQVNEANLDEPIHFDIGVDSTNYNGEAKIWKYVITDKIAAGMSYVVDGTHPFEVKVGNTTVLPYDATNNPNGYTITWYTADPHGTPAGTEVTPATAADKTASLKTAQFFRIELPWTSPVGPFCDEGCTTEHTHNWLKDAVHLYPSAAEIHVNYYGKLDSEKADKVNYETANENTAKFTWYEDHDKPTPDGKDPEPEHPEKKTETYVTELKLYKYVKDGETKNPLQGAEFTLTREGESFPIFTTGVQYVPYDAAAQDSAGTATNPIHNYERDGSNAIKAYYELKSGGYTDKAPTDADSKPELYVDGTGNTKFMKDTFTEIKKNDSTAQTTVSAFVDANGHIVFKGLGEGNYKIEETVVPEGFNKAADITFTVKFKTAEKTWTTKINENDAELFDGTEKELYVEVENKSGSELPETGGIGTTIFYVVGAILFLGAGVVLVTRRKVTE